MENGHNMLRVKKKKVIKNIICILVITIFRCAAVSANYPFPRQLQACFHVVKVDIDLFFIITWYARACSHFSSLYLILWPSTTHVTYSQYIFLNDWSYFSRPLTRSIFPAGSCQIRLVVKVVQQVWESKLSDCGLDGCIRTILAQLLKRSITKPDTV